MALNFKDYGGRFYEKLTEKEQERIEKDIEKYKQEFRFRQQQETNKIIALSGMLVAFVGGINLLFLIHEKVNNQNAVDFLIATGVIFAICATGGFFLLILSFLRIWQNRGE